MNKNIASALWIPLLIVVFFALVLVNNQLLSNARVDLTENRVYSLSDGSKHILSELDEPINLYFFYSNKASKGMTLLRNYANRVQSLLEEYESAADGKIRLQIIDPEPFSESEDLASQYGLTAASIGPAGEGIYLGLAGTNALDDQEVLPFFDPQRESFLEYELSKLIYKLSNPTPVKVAVMTGLPIEGQQNPMTGRFDPAWVFYTQLQQLYQVEKLAVDAQGISADTDVLVLIHPKDLSDGFVYALDQFVLKGGKLMVFVDPHSESDPMAAMGGFGTANSSNLDKLFAAWGVDYDPNQVVLDAALGLEIRTQDGGITRHMGFVGLGSEQLDREDVVTASLEVINGASFGALSKSEEASFDWLALMTSSPQNALKESTTYAMNRDPAGLAEDFTAVGSQQVLAARLSGTLRSAYDGLPEGTDGAEWVEKSDSVNIIIVADTDLLSDRFWVTQQNFFGQTLFTPFANNGDFITNGVENMGGSSALIGVRSRGTFARPFDVVDELTVTAEAKFREQEQILQRQLEETEAQLQELQSQQGDSGALVISPQQQQAIDDFADKRIEIRKALREVRHQLDKDIELLGNWLKFINVAAAPVALVLLLMLFARVTKKRARRAG